MRTMKGKNMKRILGLLTIITGIFLIHQNAFAAEPLKIGVLNLQQCLMESNEGKRIAKDLSKKLEAMQKKIDTAQTELVEMQKEMEKQSLMLSLDAKEDKQKEYDKKQRDVGYLMQDLNEEAKKAEAEAKGKFLKDLEGVLIAIAEKGKYDLILERISGGVLFASETSDITEQVIEAYNKEKP